MQGSPWQYRQLDTLSFINIMNSWLYTYLAELWDLTNLSEQRLMAMIDLQRLIFDGGNLVQ